MGSSKDRKVDSKKVDLGWQLEVQDSAKGEGGYPRQRPQYVQTYAKHPLRLVTCKECDMGGAELGSKPLSLPS